MTIPGVLRKGAAVLARLLRRDDAVAAVEFAILGSTFLMLVCMTLELGLILFTQSVMDNALRDAARLIQTNQASSSSTFTTKVCGEVGNLIPNCSTNLKYYVQTASLFSSMTAQTAFSSNAYTAGTSSADMLAQIAYQRPTITHWATVFFGTNDMIISTVAFQNEPY
ncbi:MAG TPA: TadE/TadG family type IV pilus assembly protein [Stellaceae bacterium]|jgi:Flp pilus assembly protein TadG|nr:TadE/TadG family type IV pilus assembly protein [Stellaceae bacterium]